MQTRRFDAAVELIPGVRLERQGRLVLGHRPFQVDLRLYPGEDEAPAGEVIVFVQFYPAQALDAAWGDELELWDRPGKVKWARGRVLDPEAPKLSSHGERRRKSFLEALDSDARGMLYALTRNRGVKGLTECDIEQFARLSAETRAELARALEAEGRIKILSFSPLHLLAESSFVYLCARMGDFIEKKHHANPDMIGIPSAALQERFALPNRVHWLALKRLEKEGRIRRLDDRILPADLLLEASQEEERLLKDLEELSLQGELRRVSLDELRARFRVSAAKFDRLLMFLTERKKVVQGRDGFLIHSQWLDTIISRLRARGRDQITIAEFKELTGLSRRYAIPLLELLDQLGVTRRRGSIREIL
jgi:selenocysteine-specific elongation factor